MKKLIAAAVAAAFSLSIAGVAIAAPAQVTQRHSQATQIQADKPADQSTKKKTSKKSGSKKKTAKKGQKKKAA
jgi:hypothetical protein